ncbi:MAG: hypothetical protein IJM59_10860 [Proteobacteria bacterium]|nr:hypothetical protein [Pseudomonadota bacterium]
MKPKYRIVLLLTVFTCFLHACDIEEVHVDQQVNACPPSQIVCQFSDSSALQCVSPADPQTCGAHRINGTNQCEMTVCSPEQICVKQENRYQCTERDDCTTPGMQLCTSHDHLTCISKLDPQNCGECDHNCLNAAGNNAHGNDCKLIDETYICTFECDAGYTNCPPGNEILPECARLDQDIHHCGACGHQCDADERCIEGQCQKQPCPANQCETKDDAGEQVCINTDFLCGPACDNCLALPGKAPLLSALRLASGRCSLGSATRTVLRTVRVSGPATPRSLRFHKAKLQNIELILPTNLLSYRVSSFGRIRTNE